MKILHTSDWHIGKRLMGRERLDEQAEVLDEIVGICDREAFELVLIAGDIFDTYTPSAEAEDLFFNKIKRIAGEDRAVLIISGNHDDGVRLSAVAPLSEDQGIFVAGNARKPLKTGASSRKTRPVLSGKGYAVFENGAGERAYISTLPYPNEARFKEERSELPYIEQMQKWIAEGAEHNADKLPSDAAVEFSYLRVSTGEAQQTFPETAGEYKIRAIVYADGYLSKYFTAKLTIRA